MSAEAEPSSPAWMRSRTQPDRVNVVSYGEDRPIANADDAASRRTVVIYIE